MQTTSPAPTPAPTSTGSTATPPPAPAKKSMLWLWILLAVIGVLLIAGIVVAIFFFMRPATPATTNTANTTNETNNRADNTTNETGGRADDELSEEAYFREASDVLDLIGQSIDSWNDAAIAGADGDFDNSNEALLDGLDILDEAEGIYDDLVPPSSVRRVHDLLGDAIAKGQEAMELGLAGNNTEDIDKITESGEAIDDLGSILDQIIRELDDFTGVPSVRSSLIDQLQAVQEDVSNATQE